MCPFQNLYFILFILSTFLESMSWWCYDCGKQTRLFMLGPCINIAAINCSIQIFVIENPEMCIECLSYGDSFTQKYYPLSDEISHWLNPSLEFSTTSFYFNYNKLSVLSKSTSLPQLSKWNSWVLFQSFFCVNSNQEGFIFSMIKMGFYSSVFLWAAAVK